MNLCVAAHRVLAVSPTGLGRRGLHHVLFGCPTGARMSSVPQLTLRLPCPKVMSHQNWSLHAVDGVLVLQSCDTSLNELHGAARSQTLGSGVNVAVLGSGVTVLVLGLRGVVTLPCRVTPCLSVAVLRYGLTVCNGWTRRHSLPRGERCRR